MTTTDDPLRDLLQAMADQLDRLEAHLERLADEMYVGTAPRHAMSVIIDSVPWQRVPDLERSGPDDPHYVVERAMDGSFVIRFGDGVRGRRPPAGSSIVVRYGGRAAGTVYGIQRGVVVDAHDPSGRGRLLVQVPAVSGESSAWALPCFPPSGGKKLPAAGDLCWVLYESGDVDRPVWLGTLVKGS